MQHMLRTKPIGLFARISSVRRLTTLPRETPQYANWKFPLKHAPVQNGKHEAQLVERKDRAPIAIRSVRLVEKKHNELLEGLQEREAEQYAARTDGPAVTKVLDGKSDVATSPRFRHLRGLLEVGEQKQYNHIFDNKLWRAYRRLKDQYPDALQLLSQKEWGILFAHQSHGLPGNQLQAQRSYQLYQDMELVGKAPTLTEHVTAVKCLSTLGKKKQALQLWHDRISITDTGDSGPMAIKHVLNVKHLAIGALLHAECGNTERAYQLATELYDRVPQYHPRLMMTIFNIHMRFKGTQNHQELAHKIYISSKGLLGTAATGADHFAWLNSFLRCRYLEDATDVFKAMVQTGHLAGGYSSFHVRRVLKTLQLLCGLGKDFEDVTKVVLAALSVLPTPYHLHVFHQWMVLATIGRTPESALRILELMAKRGVQPHTSHLNLLLKALRRSSNTAHVVKAEDIGWRMVEEHNEQSAMRYDIALPLLQRETMENNAMIATGPMGIGAVEKPKIPPADSDTFAILLQHHTKEKQWEHVNYLMRRLETVHIRPTSALMNILLVIARWNGDYDGVFRLFRAWTDESKELSISVTDGACWRHLWATLRYAGIDNYEGKELPTPRQLLAKCVEWWELVRNQPGFGTERFRLGLGGRAIQKMIMHCFNNANDLPGQVVALHIMRKMFGFFPLEEAYDLMRYQIIKNGLSTPTVRPTHVHAKAWERNKQRIDRVYHVLMQRRFRRMRLTGDDYAGFSNAQVADLNLNLLSEFARVILKRQCSPQEVEVMIDNAKREIGVPDLKTGDLDAFSVA